MSRVSGSLTYPRGTTPVRSYQLCFLKNGMPAGRGTIEARDDDEACRIVAQMARPETIELWREGRRLRTIFPARRPALTD